MLLCSDEHTLKPTLVYFFHVLRHVSLSAFILRAQCEIDSHEDKKNDYVNTTNRAIEHLDL